MDQSLHRSVPTARVVRQGGEVVPPPRASLGARFRGVALVVAARGRDTAAVAIGLWPLTAILIMMVALLWTAGVAGSP